ncbi:MAG: VOC family protein [Trueperaceae bacterium]
MLTETRTTTTQPANHAAPAGIAPRAQRLPADTSLGRVRLQVADLEHSLAWYQSVLGLKLLEREANAATLGTHADEPLVELRELAGARPVPRRGRLGLYHYALLLPDRPSLGAFLSHLAQTGERAGASDHLVSEALYLNDPDGLGIEVYADRPRDEWSVQSREIQMATIPLNAADLALSARNTPWEGMPAGTKMGHVHLHIGDIDVAEEFYHHGLGFDKVVWSYPGALFLSAGGYHHHLGLNTWAATSPGAGQDDARLLDWEIALPSQADVEAAGASLAAAGHQATADGNALQATDPWGTTVRLLARG